MPLPSSPLIIFQVCVELKKPKIRQVDPCYKNTSKNNMSYIRLIIISAELGTDIFFGTRYSRLVTPE